MEQEIYNPYLPLDTYIPDGEPHIFGDALYLQTIGDTMCDFLEIRFS